MTRIAVTGARGFVGRALVARLRQGGVECVTISHGQPLSRREGAMLYVETDYGDAPALAKHLSGCDAVIHLAARAHQVGESLDADMKQRYREANVAPVLTIAEAARLAGVPRVVLVSSIGVNGNATYGRPFTEISKPAPTEPYAASKLEAEGELARALASGATDWVVLRPPLVYGPGCPGNLKRLIDLAARAPLLPFGGLHAPRTMIALDNLLDALLVATRHPAVSRRAFVVADARDVDVAEILGAFLDGLGRGSWRLLAVPAPLLGVLASAVGKGAAWRKLSGALQVDASTFAGLTGWRARIDPRDGLRASVGRAGIQVEGP